MDEIKVLDKQLLESAKSGKHRVGRTLLIKYLTGGRLTQRQAIKAKCFDCNGMGEQGVCDISFCSLFPYSPYNVLKKQEKRAKRLESGYTALKEIKA